MTRQQLDSLVNDILESTRNVSSLLICVGPGASISAGLPSWTELMHQLYDDLQRLIPETNRPEYKEFVERSSPAESAELLRSVVGTNIFTKKVRKLVGQESIQPSAIHRTLAQLPARAIVTTNFDTLIEKALIEANRPFTTIVTEHDIVSLDDEKLKLCKMHGSVDQPATIEFPGETYRSSAKANSSMETALRTLFTVSLNVFVGFDIDNPDFKQLYRLYKSDAEQVNWIVLTPTMNPISVELWRHRGVRLVPLEAKDDAEFLTILGQKLHPKSRKLVRTEKANRIFISSSSESLPIVRELQQILKSDVETVVWSEISRPGLSFWESLEQMVSSLMGVIMILSPNDEVRQRQVLNPNTVFELGYLTAALGRERIMVILGRDQKIPIDIAGMRFFILDEGHKQALFESVRKWAATIREG